MVLDVLTSPRAVVTFLEAVKVPLPFWQFCGPEDLTLNLWLVWVGGLGEVRHCSSVLFLSGKPRFVGAGWCGDRKQNGGSAEHCCKRLGVLRESPSTGAYLGWVSAPVALVLLSWTQGSGRSSSGEGWPPWPEDICPELWEGWEAGAPGAGEDKGCTVPLHPACRP